MDLLLAMTIALAGTVVGFLLLHLLGPVGRALCGHYTIAQHDLVKPPFGLGRIKQEAGRSGTTASVGMAPVNVENPSLEP